MDERYIRKGMGILMIKHSEAFELEHIVRRVFDCDRYGFMGIADADHFREITL